MLTAQIDHITIAAPTLAEGVAYVQRTLGVTPQPGGEHRRMGTHNCLLRLGDALFLEVIAINPAAPSPGRPRWFELDARDQSQPPALLTWVARTGDIRAAQAAAPDLLGPVEPMSRGTRDWLITIPVDGALPMQGIAPTLIEWDGQAHPATTLIDNGCTLRHLEAFHPDAGRLRALLDAIGFAGTFTVAPPADGQGPGLIAHIDTPAGPRTLASCPDWSRQSASHRAVGS